MVWISKREIAYYIILKEEFRDRIFNLGEAIDVLVFFGSKKVAKKVIKNLVKKGFIKKVDDLNYKVEELEGTLKKLLYEYIRQRFYKALKSRGYSVAVNKDGGNVIVICEDGVELELPVLLSRLGISIVKCKKGLY
jgi:ribosomal protein S8